MLKRSSFVLLVLLAWACLFNPVRAQTYLAKTGGPLICHKVTCPLPQSVCQVLASQSCVKGGGPPQCPAIVNAPDGTACNSGSLCETNVCTGGVCGTPIVCSSPTDVCAPSSGTCATPCDAAGCVVAAANGYLAPTLTVPPGALSGPVNINMVDQGSDPNDPDVFHLYSFGPSGTTFSTPATVDLPAPALDTDETVLIEVSEDGITWVAVDTTLNNGRASGPISSFSHCRTRKYTNLGSTDLVVEDMVDYQDVVNVLNPGGLVIPPPGEAGACYSGDIYGLCFKMKNITLHTVSSVCPGPPTPTNPPPKGCRQMHVIPWQCYTAYRDYPAPFDPSNPTAFEGQHCDITGLLIPCADSVYNLDSFLPPGGLAPGQEIWVDLNFSVNTPPTANGNLPFSCFGSSFIGVDLLFREPSGSCAPGAACDWQAGIRSAMAGPHIEVPAGKVVYLPAGVAGCIPAPGATTCPATCSPVPPSTTCQAEWDWLANHPANYPMLRFTPSDTAIKNWLNDARF